MAHMRNFLANTILVLLSIFGAIVLVDVLLHFSQVQYRYVSPQAPKGYFQFDPELGYDIVPNFATSTHRFSDLNYPMWGNSIGCFDTEYDGSTPYIYVGGDSMAWGFARLEDKWGKKVQNLLGIRTVTCGVNGFGARQEVIKARRTISKLPEPPKVMIVTYFNNDVGDDTVFPNYNIVDGYVVFGQGQCSLEQKLEISPLEATSTCNVAPMKYPWFQYFKFKLGLNSVLYSMVSQSFGKKIKSALQPYKDHLGFLSPIFPWLVPPKPTEVEKEIAVQQTNTDLVWKFHESNVLAMKKLADSYGAKLMFIVIPDDESVYATSTKPEWITQRMVTFLKANNIHHIDLWRDFHDRNHGKERTFFWPLNGHINVEGNQLTGLLVTKYVLENRLIDLETSAEILKSINEEIDRDFPVITK